MAEYQPTQEQQEILAHEPDTHARLLAGPGTGKSATVIALLLKLLATEPPPRVKLLTFTRAATAELAHKVSEHPDVRVDRPSTVHSFAVSVLLANPGSANFPDPFRIADDWEMKNLIAPDLAAMVGVTPTTVTGKLIPEMAASWESLEVHEHPGVDKETRNKFVGCWQSHRLAYGYVLLAEPPHLLREALDAHDDLKGLDFDMVVVDEYQDLNACELAILRQLADRDTSIFGVGDDDQSIYSFRRAAPEGIRRFLDDYPAAADYTLSVSHRCGSDIITWARHVIEGDHTRLERPPLKPADGASAGEVALLAFPSNVTEARGVAELIAHLVNDEGIQPPDIAVLLRGDHNHSFSKPIKEELDKLGITYDDPSWVSAILNNESNRATMLRLRLLGNRKDSLAWAGLLHLERGVSANFRRDLCGAAIASRHTFADELLAGYENGFSGLGSSQSGKKAGAFVKQTLDWLDAQEVPDEREGSAWGAWIVDAFNDDAAVPVSDELAQLLSVVDSTIDPDTSLSRYVGQIEPLARDHAQAEANGVRFMTMASSKGLTVEAAIVVGAEEGVIPSPYGDEAEERRLLYVAMTRARRFHYVTRANTRTGPTARSGDPNVRGRRTVTRFLTSGPVGTTKGEKYLKDRWGPAAAA